MKFASKRILALLLAVAMILSALPSVFAENVGPFTDVDSTAWYADFVLTAYEEDLMNGMTATTFDPDANLTRAQTAMVLYRLAGEPPVAIPASFVDLTQDWYKNAVAWAEAEKVVNGVGDGRFDPDGLITREALVTMMYRFAKGTKVSEDRIKSFPDASSVSDWSAEALNWALANDIIGGTEEIVNGVKTVILNPLGNATRAQFAKIVTILSDLMAPCDVHTWDEGKVTKEATCSEEGQILYTCSVCGSTKTELIAKLAHTDADGDKKCDVCGENIVCEHVWNDGVVTTPATCTEDGVKTFTCTLCGETKTEAIAKLGHADANEDGKCDNCGEDMGVIAGNTFKLATALTDGDKVVLFNPANGVALSSAYGSHKNLAGVEAVPVNGVITTEDANIIWTVVDNGDGSYGLKAETGLLGATPTTGTDGKTYYDFYVDGTGEDNAWVITPISGTDRFDIATKTLSSNYGPVFIEWYNGLYKAYSTGRNNSTFYNADAMGFQLYVLGGGSSSGGDTTCTHVWDNGVITTAATCTTDGVKTFTCTLCGATKTETVPATGHIDANGDGKCDSCGMEAGKTEGYVLTDALNDGDKVVIYNAGGDNAIASVVKGSYYLDYAAVAPVGDVITTEDESLVWTVGKNADGTYTFTSANGTMSMNVSTGTDGKTKTSLSLDGANPNMKVESCNAANKSFYIYSATLQGGYGNIYLEWYAQFSDFSAYSTSVDRLTEEAFGFQFYALSETCNHLWNAGVVTTEATCTADGVKTYTCVACGETRTEVIPALGHDYVDGVCSRCGEEEPNVEPTEPSVEPTEPSVEPTEPSVEPTEPSIEPTEPSVEPTEPVLPIEPTELNIGDTLVMTATVDSGSYELSGFYSTAKASLGAATAYTDAPAGTFPLTVEAGTETGTYAFKTEDGKYLSWKDGNSLDASETLDTNSSWTVTINENGTAKIANATTATSADADQRVIVFNLNNSNNGSPRFAAYTKYSDKIGTTSQYALPVLYLVGATAPCEHKNTVDVPEVPATCTEAGKTAGVKCADCGKLLSGCTEIPALGHIDENNDNLCDRCGEEVGSSIPPAATLNIGDVIAMTATVGTDNFELTGFYKTATASLGSVEKFTGTPAGTLSLTVEAGTETGSYAFRTEDSKYLSWTEANSLDASETLNANSSWVVTFNENGTAKIANATTASEAEDSQRVILFNLNNGSNSRFATYTGYSTKSTQTAQYGVPILYVLSSGAPCEHKNTVDVPEVPATCTEAGKTAGVKCADCGKLLSGCTEIAALGHIDEDGNDFCDRCGEDLSVAEGSFLLADSINDGDEVIIYNAGSGNAVANVTKGTYYLDYVTIAPQNDAIATEDATIIWTVTENADGSYTFTSANGTLSMNATTGSDGKTKTSLSLDGANPNMTVETCNAANKSFYLYSATVQGGYGNIYLEWYANFSDFSAYSTSVDRLNESAFGFQFYAKAGCTHANTVDIPEVPATCTEAGTTAGVKCADCGELLSGCTEIPATGHNYVGGVCTGCGKPEPTDGYAVASSVQNGDQIVFVAEYEGKYYALTNSVPFTLGNGSSAGALGTTEVNIEDGKLDIPSGADVIWTLESGASEGTLKMKNSADAYINFSGSGTKLLLGEGGYDFTFACGAGASTILAGSNGIFFRNMTTGTQTGPQFRAYTAAGSATYTIWKVA